MLETYTVSFFGHRRIYNQLSIDRQLDSLITQLLRDHEYVEFLVGRDGDFDQMVFSAIRRCKRKYRSDNSSLTWVMPYPTAFFLHNEEACREYYDEIQICDESAVCHYKSAFQIRNRCLIDRSDLAIFYVEEKRGGAYATMKYAIKTGAKYINLYTKELRDAR